MSLRLSSLLILMSIYGHFNLDLDGFLALLLLISNYSALWKLEVLKGGVLPTRNGGQKAFLTGPCLASLLSSFEIHLNYIMCLAF